MSNLQESGMEKVWKYSMIYLILGASCSGKTQLVTNSFISKNAVCYRDLVPVTKTDTAHLIGDFTREGKVRGTDKISRSQLKLIAPQIIKCFNDSNLDVVAEGINVCWNFVLNELVPYKDNIKMIYLNSSLETSLRRNIELNKDCNKKWFKSVYTRSENAFLSFSNKFDSYVINTENADFSKISLTNCELIPFAGFTNIELF